MNLRRVSSHLVAPGVLTLLLLCARIFPVPPLTDPVAGTVSPAIHLSVPWLYLAMAPLFTLWDGVSMLSMTRLAGFLAGLVVMYLAWRIVRFIALRSTWLRELATLAVSLVLFTGFVVVGAVWHRPMLSLAGTGPQEIVVDFHSHTNVSHDVRDTWMRGFDAEANRRWHSRAGFDAAFITDHNVASRESPGASRESPVTSRQSPVAGRGLSSGSTALCPGIEISAWRAHIVLLGSTGPVDRSRYKGYDGLLALLATSDSAYGALSVASLPEYRRYHWGRLDTLVAAGLDGFELVNASPKANELTRAEVDSVIAVARRHNVFVAGVSDSHGWGATSMVWNLVRSPVSNDPCSAVLRQLRSGFPAVSILERHRVRPDDPWPMWLTPVAVVWETWRSMGWLLTAAWLVWIWALAYVKRRITSSRRTPQLQS